MPAHLSEGFPQETAVRKGAEITRSIVFFDSGQPEPREFFARIDAYEEEAFVVREIRVVSSNEFYRYPVRLFGGESR